MSKHLLLALFLVPACTITINGSGSEGNTTPQNTDSGPGSDTTTDDPSGATTEVPTTGSATTATTTAESTTTVASSEGSNTDTPTTQPVGTDSTGTGESTAEGTSSGDSSETGSGEESTGTGGPSEYGLCGWNVMKTYYACPGDGGVPGLADPKNNYPIDCREQELGPGAECGQIGLAGCCTAEGNLYYCNEGGLVEQKCGV